MSGIIEVIRAVAVVIAAVMVGKWYMDEANAIKRKGLPWYRIYYTIPGMLVILAVLAPIVYWLFFQ